MAASISSDDKHNAVDHIDKTSFPSEEAQQHREIDGFRVFGIAPQDVDFYTSYPDKKRDKIFRKVDVRLVPMLAALYLISHIDRANIGNAKIEGMVPDIGMSSLQYNIVLSIFFIPYIIFEIPSNILLKKFKRPSHYLGILVVSWGIIMTCTGFVKNFAGLMVVRVLLGVFEAGFFPGAIYLCSYWYMPKSLTKRISVFLFASALSGAFSGLLAAGIAKMHGVGNLEGWRWIFILEGILTVVLGVACFFLLIDTPALSERWFEPDEIRYLELSMLIKQGGRVQEDNGFRTRDLKKVLANWRIYVLSYLLLCTKFTLPTITQSMGFNRTNAQLTSAPPYMAIAGALSALFFAWCSDRLYWRMPFVAIPMLMTVIGYSVVISLHGKLEQNIAPAYFAITFSVMGIYPIQTSVASWNANNLAPESRRAIGIALLNCVGNLGGVLGSFMYLEKEKPKYYTGFGLSLALGVTGIMVALALEWSYKVTNAKKAKIVDQMRAEHTEEQLFDMGDKSPLFKHVL